MCSKVLNGHIILTDTSITTILAPEMTYTPKVMSNFWGAVHDDLPLFTDRISAALSYNAVPAVYKAMTADKESFHQE